MGKQFHHMIGIFDPQYRTIYRTTDLGSNPGHNGL